MPKKSLLLIITFTLWIMLAHLAKADDLLTIYQLAKTNDPTLQAKKSEQLATSEAKPQALAKFLPEINANATNKALNEKATSGNALNAAQTGNFNTTTTVTHYNQSTYCLTLTQPIFYYQQWIANAKADEQVKGANATYGAAEQDLIVRTVQNYFAVLKAIDALKYAKAQRKAFAKFLEQTEERFKVGLIAITDVQIAKAQHDNAYAQEIAAENALANQQENLREIVGQPIESFSFLKEDLTLQTPEPANLEQWVNTALEQNLSLQASRSRVRSARADIKIAQAHHLPTLNIQSDLQRQTSTPLNASTLTSDVMLNVTFPIFSGGATRSKTKQAVYTYEQHQKEMETLYRQVESSARQAYRGVLTQIAQVKALKQAIISNTSALQATDAAFNVGTRTIVDVLKSQSDLIQAEQNYANARYDYILQSVQLKKAAGTLSPEDVQHINGWLINPSPK
jgi:outer membrane protein